MTIRPRFAWILAVLLVGVSPRLEVAVAADAPAAASIFRATLGETGEATPEISTEELEGILDAGSAVVFDARPFREYAVSHIPGAQNVAAKPGVPMSHYVSDVAEIGRVLHENKAAPVVLYCNGPFCGKSKRLGAELKTAGYTNVRRYQLGIPVWRALGKPTQIEPAALGRVLSEDRPAWDIAARNPDAYRAGTIAGARNLPRAGVLRGKDVGVVKEAKNDGRLPVEDHNTRVIVLAKDAADARFVAEALAREAFHNVAYFGGTFEEAVAATK